MNLKSITIKNYRSIKELTFNIDNIDDNSFTYGLIGVNEAGKSSILKALALKDNLNEMNLNFKDFHDINCPIEIVYLYKTTNNEQNELFEKQSEILAEYFTKNSFELININYKYFNGTYTQNIEIDFPNFVNEKKEFDLNTLHGFINHLKPFILEKCHKTIFWKSDPKYLISQPINLENFSNNPDNISIPLRNCFQLSGIENISEINARLKDSTEREYLRDILSDKVTSHVRKIWPKHPIKITFDISDGYIHFHVKDLEAKEKAKTADQRSDGFRQFVSFLLTLSAESRNKKLKNTIVLLDEPETHLHPKAQEDLLNELINLTKDNSQNLVFFATHSNYMVDKLNIDRYFNVEKPKYETKLKCFDKRNSTYASVNYEVFKVNASEYHNQLYGTAEYFSNCKNNTEFDKKLTSDKTLIFPKKNYLMKSDQTPFECSLSTYIRHKIHHPENRLNEDYTDNEIKESINLLTKFIDKLQKNEN